MGNLSTLLFLATLFSVVVALSADTERGDKFKVVGYVPEYRLHAVSWEMVGPLLTHAILFSLEMDPSGELLAMDRFPDDENLKELHKTRERSGMKVLVGFGGNGRSESFAPMTTNPKSRKNFISHVVELVEKYQLDGVDYNWEYPGFRFDQGYLPNPQIRAEFGGLRDLVKDTREAFNKIDRPLEITIAYYPDGKQERILKSFGIFDSIDLAHAMAYDQGRIDHSPVSLVATVIKYAKTHALPLEKVTVGVPFYGRDEKTGHARSYEEILDIDPERASFRDSDVVYRFGRAQGLRYNGPETIEKKTKMALEAGLGGVMIWEIGQDCRMKEVTRNQQFHAKTCPSLGSSLLYSIKMGKKEYKRDLLKKERELQMAIEIDEKLKAEKEAKAKKQVRDEL